jgi:hypothetical protein
VRNYRDVAPCKESLRSLITGMDAEVNTLSLRRTLGSSIS